MSTDEKFVSGVQVLIGKCAKDKARLFFIAHQVLEEMQSIDHAAALSTLPAPQAAQKDPQ